jgi:hypothetical protein
MDDVADVLATVASSDNPLLIFPVELGVPILQPSPRARGPADRYDHVPDARIALKLLVSRVGVLKKQLDDLEQSAARFTREYSKVEADSRESGRRSSVALLQDLARTEDRLEALDKLATRLSEKMAESAAVIQLDRLTTAFGHWSERRRWLGQRVNQALRWLGTMMMTPIVAHRHAIIVWLGLLPLVCVMALASLGTIDKTRANRTASHASPPLSASTFDLPLLALPPLPSHSFVATREVVATRTSNAVSIKPPRSGTRSTLSAQPTEFVGALAVDSNPAGAAVFLNQRRIGVTPLELPGLQSGSHVVWIEYRGYLRWTAAVDVAADTRTRVSVKLQPDRAP